MPTSDTPILKPDQDHFGFDPLARALARSISVMNAPEGVVIAINGLWGSGKSSLVNLVLHHLSPGLDQKTLAILRFNPWWFSGAEMLAAAFLGEMRHAIGATLGKKALNAFKAVAGRVLPRESLLKIAAEATLPGTGELAGAAGSILAELFDPKEELDTQHGKLAKLLSESKQRFVIVLDDIDRLSPDESLQLLKLIKSVGRLPNTIYMLALDRKLVEKQISDRFPSEGPHYLEKIVQAFFDVPAPSRAELGAAFFSELEAVCGPEKGEDPTRFQNVIIDLVLPFLRTPRDVKRFVGILEVTWPGVQSDVNRADFLAIEALRLFRPKLYEAIRDNPDMVTGHSERTASGLSSAEVKGHYDALLLAGIPDKESDRIRRAMQRVFPKLEAVWSNRHWGEDWSNSWRRERRVCSVEHFPTYFRFEPSDQVVRAEEIEQLIQKAGDRDFVQSKLRAALKQRTKAGSTMAAVILDELIARAEEVSEQNIRPLITSLFEIADELDVEEDEQRGFVFGDNVRRMHWLMNTLVRDRATLPERIQLIRQALKTASLHWFCAFASRCYREHHPLDSQQPRHPENDRFVDEPTSSGFREEALRRLRSSARNGRISTQRRLVPLLFEWKELSTDAEVRSAVIRLLKRDEFVINMAASATGRKWSQGAGDLVALGTVYIQPQAIEGLADPAKFIRRVRLVVASPKITPEAAQFLTWFLETWKRQREKEETRSAPALNSGR